jgi:hypothetical protein
MNFIQHLNSLLSLTQQSPSVPTQYRHQISNAQAFQSWERFVEEYDSEYVFGGETPLQIDLPINHSIDD